MPYEGTNRDMIMTEDKNTQPEWLWDWIWGTTKRGGGGVAA